MLTEQIHKFTNENVIDKRLLGLYSQSLKEEKAPESEEVVKLYERAGVELPGTVKKQLTDVQQCGGVESMKVFCYDLSLAQLWPERQRSPGLLVHDSVIFDGVDERQKALAFQLAAREAKAFGFQYICTMNSAAVPWMEFGKDFDFNENVRLRLSDKDESSNLTGICFEVDEKEEDIEYPIA